MKKQGFTLMELLAVIVILGVILLIATPIILNIIKDIRIGAFESSAKNIIRTSELTYATNMLKGDTSRLEFYYEDKDESSNKIGAKLNYTGEKPDYGYVLVNSKGKTSISLYKKNIKTCINKGYNSNKLTIIKDITKEKCLEVLPTPTIALNVEDEEFVATEGSTLYEITSSDYEAYLSTGESTANVKVYINGIETNIIDLNKPGQYIIVYRVIENELMKEISRVINVKDNIYPAITILGDNPITIKVGGEYTELGATAIDNVDGDITDKITINNQVNITEVGNYYVYYKVKDTSGNETNAIRTVIVEKNLEVIQVSANIHTVFLMEDGTVKTVGRNNFGQLGDGTQENKSNPISVPSLFGVKQVSAGEYYAMFLMNDGTVKAVGRNDLGQLGDGTDENKNTLITIPELNNVKQIESSSHTVFLMNDGTVKAVGYNNFGQLGDGTTIKKVTPVTISGLSGVKQIAVGQYHTIFLMNNGTVKAVGYNSDGPLGDGTTISKTTPITIPNLNGVKQIAAGQYHTMFLMNDGTVKAVGYNDGGRLGDGTTISKTTPITIPGLSGVKQIAAGQSHTAFLMNDETVMTVGINNSGQLGDGTTINKSTPITIPNLNGVKQISAGNCYTVLLMNDGTVKSVGINNSGQLGDGTTTLKSTPVNVIFK